MRDEDCVRLLQACLPRLGLRWAGYRRVRGTVCKRIDRRCAALGLSGPAAYLSRLEAEPAEWACLEAFCRIPISRFYRDRGVFDRLGGEILPMLAARAARAGRDAVSCWSAGCASGEEPYSLAIAWRMAVAPRFPGVALEVLASDAEAHMLVRAGDARYGAGSLKDLPAGWRDQAFECEGGRWRLRPAFREAVRFLLQDIRAEQPPGPFDLILCRNLVFTYFEPALQARLLAHIGARLRAGGILVIGAHEALPPGPWGLSALAPGLPIFAKD
jgi:chemotaxis protein methyltransferase CheR